MRYLRGQSRVSHPREPSTPSGVSSRRSTANGMRQLLKVVEQSGTVVTIRELLMLVSQSITGGLRCTDVHPRSSELDWQAPYLFHQAIFGEGVDDRQRLNSCCSDHSARWTPDTSLRVGSTNISSALTATAVSFSACHRGGGEPKTRPALQSLDRQHRALMTSFGGVTSSTDSSLAWTTGLRLGLRHMEDFEAVVEGEPDAQFLSDVRNRLLGGLETIQGIRREQGANFLLVDPAFARSTGASLIARLVQRTSYSVGPASRRPSDLDPGVPLDE